MKFINKLYENEELTYEDVFILQDYFDGISRLETNITPNFDIWTTLPIVSANMNAVTGKRMAETLARYWALGVLPQDMNLETLERIIKAIKSSHIKFDTPITVDEKNTVRDALWIIHKRSHNCVILVDKSHKPISIFKPQDMKDVDQYSLLKDLSKNFLISWDENITDEQAFNLMEKNSISSLPIVNKKWILIWILTKENVIRNSIYSPALDKKGKLNVSIAMWINNFIDRAKLASELWVETFVLDTAHWFQRKMIESIKLFRKEFGKKYKLIAWNLCTAEWTKALLQAWADGVKVWIGPWAMCTTRMQTAVWRPQFSAVYHCSMQAKKLWWFVWADGWIKNPRDICLALAAGASHAMIWTTLTWTYESTWDIKYDEHWNMYKENYWMASKKAVDNRNRKLSQFEIAKKQFFVEWISTSRIYLKKWRESVWNIVDEFISGLRSSMTYVWAKNLEEYNEKVNIWVQNHSWYLEWTPHGKLLK